MLTARWTPTDTLLALIRILNPARDGAASDTAVHAILASLRTALRDPLTGPVAQRVARDRALAALAALADDAFDAAEAQQLHECLCRIFPDLAPPRTTPDGAPRSPRRRGPPPPKLLAPPRVRGC